MTMTAASLASGEASSAPIHAWDQQQAQLSQLVRESRTIKRKKKTHEHLEKKGDKIPQSLQPGAGEVSVKAYQPH